MFQKNQTQPTWLLPAGIEEQLPPLSLLSEKLRRKLLDLYQTKVYEFVQPAIIEHLDALLAGTGKDLEEETFKLIDPTTGKLLGIRADITPQIARLDARQFQRQGVSRFCYCGEVLRAKENSRRNFQQLGAELYGDSGIESDLEVLSLLIESFQLAGIETLHIDLGHVGIIQNIIQQAEFNDEEQTLLLNCLSHKNQPELEQFVASKNLTSSLRELLLALPSCMGDSRILSEAETFLPSELLQDLRKIADHISGRYPTVHTFFDLAELRGYHYHTGLVFAAYCPGQGQAIAYGGRYDNIGQAFGRKRPATGFSIDLNRLVESIE